MGPSATASASAAAAAAILLLLSLSADAFTPPSTTTSTATRPGRAPFRRRHPLPSTEAVTGAEGDTKRKNTLEGREIDGEFVPINNMILVRKADVSEETGGGLILTGKAKAARPEGIVVSAGPGRTNLETGFLSPMPVSPGESVLFGKYDGTEVKYNGAKHVLIRDDDVLVKFPGGESSDESDLGGAEVLWDSVLVRLPERKDEGESSSGILLAKTTQKKIKSSVGEVVKVGPGRYAYNGVLMEMDVEAGDRIKFRDFAAQEVKVRGEDYAVVRMTDILAKF